MELGWPPAQNGQFTTIPWAGFGTRPSEPDADPQAGPRESQLKGHGSGVCRRTLMMLQRTERCQTILEGMAAATRNDLKMGCMDVVA